MIIRVSFTVLLFLIISAVRAQQAAVVDSIKLALATATRNEDKVYLMDNLARTLMNVNLPASDSVGKKLIELAEESRDLAHDLIKTRERAQRVERHAVGRVFPAS